ncbi:unnamed protein product [Trichobilharzia szidati]|nr:unnamed protein product [Trichobilharzia szidati]CAH8834448.1 unnamed protein product [Trichobilharzia szidati]
MRDLMELIGPYIVNSTQKSESDFRSNLERIVLVSDMVDDELTNLFSRCQSVLGNRIKMLTPAPLTTIGYSEVNSLPMEASAKKLLCHPVDEEYITYHLANSTRLLCMLETNVGLQGVGGLSEISKLQQISGGNNGIASNCTEEYLSELEKECNNLASELADLEYLEIMQNKAIKEKKYMDELEKILIRQNSWLKLLTCIITLECDSCKQASESLVSLFQSIQTLKDHTEQLESSLDMSSSKDGSMDPENDSKLFADAVVQLLQCSSASLLVFASFPLRSELSEKLTVEENRSENILDVLQTVKCDLASSQTSIKAKSQKLNIYIQEVKKELLEMEETFNLSSTCSSTTTPPPASHEERINPERFRFSWNGLCASDLIDRYVNMSQTVNNLADQLDSLELKVDLSYGR